ncbi:ATP-binding protein [Candidatus Riflebacteria bacterium]
MDEQTIKALLIDDDETVFKLSQAILEKVDKSIILEWAGSFNEGLSATSAMEYDVFLVDYILDGDNTGIELIQQAIKNGCKKPLIMLTSNRDPKVDRQAMEAGASDFLLKNNLKNDAESLVRAIRYSIQQKKTEITLESFNRMVAHDLKNPLSALIGFLQLLGDEVEEKFSDRGKRGFAKVMQSATKMNNLIKSLLNYASSGGKVDKETVILDEIINSALIPLEEEMEKKGSRLERSLQVAKIYADRGLLIQVFNNLFSNALKYSDPQRPPVIVVSAKELATDNKIEITVKDNGMGIKKEKLGGVFQEFTRVHDPRIKTPGHGIGLATVRRIILSHRGEIKVESEFGKGSTFIIFLPLKKIK